MGKKAAAKDVPQEPVLEVEEHVQVPEEVEPVPEPSFCLVVAHVSGHEFLVEEKPSADAAWEALPPTKTFDPTAVLVARAQQTEDLWSRRAIILGRDELMATAEEDQGLMACLRKRLRLEREARHRRKWNDARRRAIAAFEAAKADPGAAEGAESEVQGPVVEPLRADFVVLLQDFPKTPEDLDQFAAEGLARDGVVDLWASVYFAGESVIEPPTDEEPPDERDIMVCETPEVVQMYHRKIQAAPLGSELANFTVCTIRNSHTQSVPPEETSLGDHVVSLMIDTLSTEVNTKHKFNAWLKAPKRVQVPDLGHREDYSERRLYQRMMGSVDASHHTVPLFLHCLTEQVTLTQQGNAQRCEDDVALSCLQDYLGSACDDVIAEGDGAPPKPGARSGSRPGTGATQASAPRAAAVGPATSSPEVPMVPFLDSACCLHFLAGGHAQPTLADDQSVVDSVHKIVDHVSVPGLMRSGLPRDAAHSTAHRAALKGRIYPFAPELAAAELEQLMILRAFEDMLGKAQPERGWNLSDRTVRELIPREFLVQLLARAVLTEPFVDTAYLPRFDCLLVALHHRCAQGRLMWHSWKGDLLTPTQSHRWSGGVFTTPTYNDWSKVFGGGQAEVPKAATLLEGFDSRTFGYATIVEKLATPADGSVILTTRLEAGIQESFAMPSNESKPPPGPDAFPDGTSGWDTESVGTSVFMALKAEREAQMAVPAFEPPPLTSTSLSRVMKDGLAFGMVKDASWRAWQEAERRRRKEDALPLPFESTELGLLWIAFPTGARCTVRMHHEHPLGFAGILESSLAQDQLPRMGNLLTYTMTSGQVIQVYSDGSVRISCPLAFQESGDTPVGGGASGEGLAGSGGFAGSGGRLDGSGSGPLSGSGARSGTAAMGGTSAGRSAARFGPGCLEDYEVMRTITPQGMLQRKLLSGRVEVYHADGTVAYRNPTMHELQSQLDSFKNSPGTARAVLELLERFLKVYEERHGAPLREPPSDKDKSLGLPGHWVVVRPDGRVIGRAQTPEEPPEAKFSHEIEEDVPAGAARLSAGGGITAGDAASIAAHLAAGTGAPSLQELVNGTLVDGGKMIEYDIEMVSHAKTVDLQTLHKTLANSLGLYSFEDQRGVQMVSVHADSTRVTRTKRDGGYDVAITKQPLAHIRCEVNEASAARGMKTFVECADGTTFEVVPQANSQGRLVPVDPKVADIGASSGHAAVSMRCRDGASVLCSGTGEVEVLTSTEAAMRSNGQAESCYIAYCDAGRLCLRDKEGSDFELRSSQALLVEANTEAVDGNPLGSARAQPRVVEPSSPRCSLPNQAYRLANADEIKVPEFAPPPRLFVIYGTGEAEELLAADPASEMLEAARSDPQAVVVGGTTVSEVCQCRTVFRSKFADNPAAPFPVSRNPPDGLDMCGSILESLVTTPQQYVVNDAAPVFTEYRQFIEYPPIAEETRSKFTGTLKQYRKWEAELVAKARFLMLPPDAKNKDKKKDKKKDDKEGQKKAPKEKRKTKLARASKAAGRENEETMEALATATGPEPAFLPDLQLSAFSHQLQVLQLRAAEVADPTPEEMLAQAVTTMQLDTQKAMDPQVELDYIPEGDSEPFAAEFASESATSPNAARPQPLSMIGDDPASPPSLLGNPPRGDEADDGDFSLDGGLSSKAGLGGSAALSATSSPKKAARQPTAASLTFSYFDSELGQAFLRETGTLTRPPVQKQKGPRNPPAAERQKRDPWHPRLIGEPEPEEEQPEIEFVQEPQPHYQEPPDLSHAIGREQMMHPSFGEGTLEEAMPFSPVNRLSMVPERHSELDGPHPSKKQAQWDVYGEARPPRPKVSQAYVTINTDYLATEGPTDRRVRTTSIAHKKNPLAPSVTAVRKTGLHAVGRQPGSMGAKELLGGRTVEECEEEHWRLSSTMQGLGDPNTLVEVVPGACRFGPLRKGSIHRMAFHLRNLDVDITRFNITPSDSEYIRLKYTPGHLAPGMATKIEVELIAWKKMKVEQLVEIKTKAHVVRVPVTARILDAEEFDRLDKQSLAVNRRRIGRHRELDPETGKPSPVQLVTDEAYCLKVMGSEYIPQLPDLED